MLGIAFAMAPPGGEGGGGGAGLFGFMPIIFMFVIFYFLLIRPQRKKQTDVRAMQKSLHKGDRVIFCGGIYGTVIKVKDNAVVVEIAENVKIDVQKTAITQVSRAE